MKTSKLFNILLGGIFLILTFVGCRKEDPLTPEQITRNEIIAIENLLKSNVWGFNDLKVRVKYESKAIPLLANVADANGNVMPGTYDAYDIFGNYDRQTTYSYLFSRDKITVDTSGGGEYIPFGGYFVLNTSDIRINPDSVNPIKFAYDYNSTNGKFNMVSDYTESKRFSDFVNGMVANAILSGNLEGLSQNIVGKLLGSDKVKEEIDKLLYDLIHGKVEEVTQNPEQVAEILAIRIVEKLSELDWETILAPKIQELLEKLQVDNPEEKAQELSVRIADKITATLSKENIYQKILPILQDFEEETLPVLATKISEAVYELIASVFTEENIYQKIYPAWDEFTQVDSSTVKDVSDTLSTVVVEKFFDKDELATKLVPFVTKLDATPIRDIDGMSQEIIDSVLVPIVENINSRFPGLELSPDWDNTKKVLTAALTTIKLGMGSSTVEEYAESLAETIIGIFDLAIGKGFEAAIYRLQAIPPEQASTVIASWIANLVDISQDPIVDTIEARLNEVFAKFDAEKVAEEIAGIVSNKVGEIFTEENLYKIILPLIESINELNMEEVAKIIAGWLIESDIVANIDEDVLVEKLTEILTELLGTADPEVVSEKLVEAIMGSDLVQGIDGTVLSKFLELKLYELFITIGREYNSIETIEVELVKK